MAYKGYFKAKNPNKYAGNVHNIIYRSGLEFRFMTWLDEHNEVISWASEEIHVFYWNPVKNKQCRYFPDFLIKIKPKGKSEQTIMVEIKPSSETYQPTLTEGKTKRRYQKEVMTWTINQAKWKFATKFCEDRKWQFKIITEKDLGLHYGK